MISKKMVILALGLLLVLTTAGCFDLFDVPGVALSPDGSQVYFLSGTTSSLDEDNPSSTTLSSVSINGGEATSIQTAQGDDVVSAFAVNPTNGDVAYLYTTAADGPRLMLYSGGSSRELVGKDILGNVAIGTMMKFSPDGSRLALTMLQFPADITPSMMEDDDNELTPEQLAAMHFPLLLVNVADGSVITVNDVEAQRANTLAWSPSGNYLAYNAWLDSNGDGKVATMPNPASMREGVVDENGNAPDPGDTSHVFVYDVGAGTSTDISSNGINYAPVFISDNEVAYVSLVVGAAPSGEEKAKPAIMAYDVSSGASRNAYEGNSQALGIAVSADRQQIAWIESSESEADAASGEGDEDAPNLLFISGPNFENPRQVAVLPSDFGIPDVPVFTPDGQSLIISATSFLSATLAQFTGGFDFPDPDADPNAATAIPAPTGQPIIKIDIATGASTEVYRGDLLNSSMFASIFSLASTGALDNLGGSSDSGDGS